MKKKQDIYKRAIQLWGASAQHNQLIEEMAELTVEICHLYRGRGSNLKIMEELADVEIMIEQIKTLYPSIEKIKEKKLRRLDLMLPDKE